MAPRIVLLDTSFVIALENTDDPHHQRARSLDRELLQEGCMLMLHWGILYEIADGYARLERRSKGLALLDRFLHEAEYLVIPITESMFIQSLDLYRARPDKDWGLTDCTSFILMAHENITEALTADDHFRQAGFRALLLEA